MKFLILWSFCSLRKGKSRNSVSRKIVNMLTCWFMFMRANPCRLSAYPKVSRLFNAWPYLVGPSPAIEPFRLSDLKSLVRFRFRNDIFSICSLVAL